MIVETRRAVVHLAGPVSRAIEREGLSVAIVIRPKVPQVPAGTGSGYLR